MGTDIQATKTLYKAENIKIKITKMGYNILIKINIEICIEVFYEISY